jgi:hypothetical protein
MAVTIAGGPSVRVQGLLDALGIKPLNVQKVVIEISPRSVVRVYITRLVQVEELDVVIGTLIAGADRAEVIPCQELGVSEQGQVFYKPE